MSKFGIDPIFPAGDITILSFCHFGWKMPNHAPIWVFLGVLNPLLMWVVIQMGGVARKKTITRTGQDWTRQDRTTKKSQKSHI